jgi:TatD DNase family protein
MQEFSFADAHCHLDSSPGALRPDGLYITCGYSHEANLKNARIAKSNPNVFLCAGIAPQVAMQHKEIKIVLQEWEEAIAEEIAGTGKLVAIGEIGLDYHWAKTNEEKYLQHECFISMLQLAERLSLPAVIHSRDAEEECVEILQNFNIPYMLHCFSGKKETAEKAANNRGIISIPPMKSKERKKIIKSLPLELLVAESDAPYIGKSPEAALESARIIAEAKGLQANEAMRALAENTASFFRIK